MLFIRASERERDRDRERQRHREREYLLTYMGFGGVGGNCTQSYTVTTRNTSALKRAAMEKKANLRMYLWWSLCTLYLHVCQARVTVGDSGLCCCTCVTYFES